MFENMMKDFENNDQYKCTQTFLSLIFIFLHCEGLPLAMVEGMMKQLISKDVLYEPMKEMYEKYPKWLATNKSKLSPNEYQNYVKQFGYIEQIMYIYDKQGDSGFGEVMR